MGSTRTRAEIEPTWSAIADRVRVVPSFLVEGYVAASDRARFAAVARRARALEETEAVWHVGSLILLEDEIYFHILEAPSVAAVIDASKRAGVEYERVVETIWIAGGQVPWRVEPA